MCARLRPPLSMSCYGHRGQRIPLPPSSTATAKIRPAAGRGSGTAENRRDQRKTLRQAAHPYASDQHDGRTSSTCANPRGHGAVTSRTWLEAVFEPTAPRRPRNPMLGMVHDVEDESSPEPDERIIRVGKGRDRVTEPGVGDVPDHERIHPVLAPIRALDRGDDQFSYVRTHLLGHPVPTQMTEHNLLARPRRSQVRVPRTPLVRISCLPPQVQHHERPVHRANRCQRWSACAWSISAARCGVPPAATPGWTSAAQPSSSPPAPDAASAPAPERRHHGRSVRTPKASSCAAAPPAGRQQPRDERDPHNRTRRHPDVHALIVTTTPSAATPDYRRLVAGVTVRGRPR